MSTHAHFEGEFGSKRKPKKVIEKTIGVKSGKDALYHLQHAKKHAEIAQKAAMAHQTGPGGAHAAEQKLIAAHAAKKAAKHASEARKLSPDTGYAVGSKAHADSAAAHLASMNTPVPVKLPGLSPNIVTKLKSAADEIAKISASPKSNQSSTGPAAQLAPASKKSSAYGKNSAAYHVEHAAKHASAAKTALQTYNSPLSLHSEKAKAALIIAHSLKKTAKHSAEAASLAPGSSNAAMAAYHHTEVANIHAHVSGTTSKKTSESPKAVAEVTSEQLKSLKAGDKFYDKHTGVQHEARAPSLYGFGIVNKFGDLFPKESISLTPVAVKNTKKRTSASTDTAYSSRATQTAPHDGKVRQFDIEEFKNLRKSFKKSLSTDQIDSAHAYSENAYMPINDALRKGQVPADHTMMGTHIKHLDTMFAKDESKLETHTKVFRGSDGEGAFNHYAKMAIGDAFVEKGYSSTSMREGSAFGGRVMMHITVPAGGRAAPIPSSHPQELEFLLPRGQKFRIDKIEHEPASEYKKARMTLHITAVQE